MRLWEIPAKTEKDLSADYDAVIVLGGLSTFDDKLDRIQFSRGSDRLMQALYLYRKGYAKKIFFTGGSGSITFPEMKEAYQVKRFLEQTGIPAEDVIIENESRNTRENAVFSKPLLDKHFPGGKFLLVTSAFHMRRATGCFEKAGIRAEGFSTDRYSGQRRYELDFLLIPSTDIFFNWGNLIHETTGYLTYKISGYL